MKHLLALLFFALAATACQKEYTPKPRAYFRISFPEKQYRPLHVELPYTFEVADYMVILPDTGQFSEPGWINVAVPANKAEIHLSYKELNNDLFKHTEDSRTLAYKHTIKADAIDEQLFINPADRVYGTIYYIDGNAASPIQFYLTDSTRHFLRGALYIREIPNIDSIRPVIQFIQEDIVRLIETTEWTR